MAEVVRSDIDNLNAVLTVIITKEDYEPKFKAALQKQSKKVQMKGFRKGKTPVSYIKKLYGRALLADEVNKMIQDTLSNYISENKVRLLGYPIPTEQQESLDFNLDELNDFQFKFDLGLAPEFELKSLDKETFSVYGVEVPAEMIDQDLEALRKRNGNRLIIENDIQENDIVEFEAIELDGDKPKEDGWKADFSVLVKDTSDAVKEMLLSKKTGDIIRFNMFEVEKDRTREHVTKYLYGASNEEDINGIGEEFEATITEVARIELPELNTDFFDKAFGEGNITSEEEARAKLEKDIAGYYDKQAESLLYRDFQDALIKGNDFTLPNEFLKRWISTNNENQNKETISEKAYEGFAKNLKWSLVQSKLVEHYNIEVKSDDVFEYIKDKIRGYFGGYGDELIILNSANRLMEDEKQVENAYQELLADRLFDTIREKVILDTNKISIEDFDLIIKKEVEKQQPPAIESSESDAEVEDVEEGIEEVAEDMD